jgi:hypothetical protein
MVEGEEMMTRDELKEKLWQELDRQDQVGCLHMGERVAAIMNIEIGNLITIRDLVTMWHDGRLEIKDREPSLTQRFVGRRPLTTADDNFPPRGVRMNWKRVLEGKVSLHWAKWQKWNGPPAIEKYWSGRLIYLTFSKLSFQIDCRINWIEDMATGHVR